MSTQAELVQRAKAFAKENYDNGYDPFFEGYDDDDWTFFVKGLPNWRSVKSAMKNLRDVWEDHRAELEEMRYQQKDKNDAYQQDVGLDASA